MNVQDKTYLKSKTNRVKKKVKTQKCITNLLISSGICLTLSGIGLTLTSINLNKARDNNRNSYSVFRISNVHGKWNFQNNIIPGKEPYVLIGIISILSSVVIHLGTLKNYSEEKRKLMKKIKWIVDDICEIEGNDLLLRRVNEDNERLRNLACTRINGVAITFKDCEAAIEEIYNYLESVKIEDKTRTNHKSLEQFKKF